MVWALVDLLLGAKSGGNSPLDTAVLTVIGIALVLIAWSLYRKTTGSPRRSAVELFALLTIQNEITWIFTIQARPGETRSALIDELRERLPEQYRKAVVTDFQVTPNVISTGTGTRFGPRRPSDIKVCWTSSELEAAK